MVLVAGAFVRLARSGGGGSVACVGVGVFWATAQSVGHADVDEVVPIVRGADDIHDGPSGLSLIVRVVECKAVLFSVTGVSHVAEPTV